MTTGDERPHIEQGTVDGLGGGAGEPTAEERAAAAGILQMISGVHISRAVYVAAELGIADRLARGRMTAAELALATQSHEASLYRVLRLLAALGVFTEDHERRFGLTILGERLRATAPASMRSWAMLMESQGGVRAFEPILETIRTGKPGLDIAHGVGIFEFLAAHPELVPGNQAAMSERTAAFAPSVAARYQFGALGSVADIGGGKGTLLAQILRTHSHLHGILFDRPQVVAGADVTMRSAGVADRCEIVAGDFFRGVPSDVDAYILANVLHDWNDTDSTRILSACRQAMPRHGRVMIVERLIPDDLAAAVPVLLSDINMLVFTGGQERTNTEYGRLLAQAGLAIASVQPVAPPYGVIDGFLSGGM